VGQGGDGAGGGGGGGLPVVGLAFGPGLVIEAFLLT
jgi:hypothetical protein